eukprot:1487052-Amphidinium_carterae.1
MGLQRQRWANRSMPFLAVNKPKDYTGQLLRDFKFACFAKLGVLGFSGGGAEKFCDSQSKSCGEIGDSRAAGGRLKRPDEVLGALQDAIREAVEPVIHLETIWSLRVLLVDQQVKSQPTVLPHKR